MFNLQRERAVTFNLSLTELSSCEIYSYEKELETFSKSFLKIKIDAYLQYKL